ncbi:hypothetical protein HMI55_005618, partial [Coelomomyces lativittatus]
MDQYIKAKKRGSIGWDPTDVLNMCQPQLPSPSKLVIIQDRVYDFKPYLNTLTTDSTLTDFLPSGVLSYLKAHAGQDLSSDTSWMNMWKKDTDLQKCFESLMLVGMVDYRKTPRCQVTNYVLLAFSVILVLVIFVKFLAALQLGSRKEPEGLNKFVILMVP